MSQPIGVQFIKISTVLHQSALSKSTLYSKIQAGLFPPPCSIGARAVAWLQGEVDTVLAAMVAGKSDNEMRALVADLVAKRKLAA